MNDRIGGMHQAIVFIAPQAETRSSQITTEDSHLCLEVFEEGWERKMQLQRAPQAQLGFLGIARAHQHVERGAVAL